MDALSPGTIPAYLHAYGRLVRTATALVRDRQLAEDIVQDAFLAVQHRTTTIRDEALLKYVRVAVINRCRDALRRRAVSERLLLDTVENVPAAEEAALVVIQRQALLTAVYRLPPRQREVIVLRFLSQLSVRETAEALSITRGAVKASQVRALRALNIELQGWMR